MINICFMPNLKPSAVCLSGLLLFLTILIALSFPVAAHSQERIAGEVADPADWPSYVAFDNRANSFDNLCAGVLIRPRWVLTAPSACMADRRDDAFAYVGATRSSPYDGEKVGIKQVYLHPRYNTEQMDWAVNPTWNIGLVKLKRPVNNVSLPTFSEEVPPPGAQISSAGLANNLLIKGSKWEFYTGLLQSSVEVLPRSECVKYLPGREGMNNRSIFCAFTPYRGPCTHDEGTGAFYNGELVGVFNLIWNGETNPNCPEDRGAGYYTALAPALPWILKVLRQGYDRGRFLDRGAYIFSDREVNLYVWANQDIYRPQIRLSENVCLLGRRPVKKNCFSRGKWITLNQNMTNFAKRGNYWMLREQVRLVGAKNCLKGSVRATFTYPGNKKELLSQAFRACVERKG